MSSSNEKNIAPAGRGSYAYLPNDKANYENPTNRFQEQTQFHRWRCEYQPRIPQVLKAKNLAITEKPAPTLEPLESQFPSLLAEEPKYCLLSEAEIVNEIPKSLRIGCVQSGGQAPGGHNVIVGIFEYIKRMHPGSQLFGFTGGPEGIYKGRYVELKEETMAYFTRAGNG